VARLKLFGPASDAAGRKSDEMPGTNVGEVLAGACTRYGGSFEDVLRSSTVWLNGEEANIDTRVGPTDEVAVLPPVSGGQ
jgi:molybdopterin converting factor small subunit